MNTIDEAWEEVGRINKAAVGCELVTSLAAQSGSYHKLSFQVTQEHLNIVGIGRYEELSGGRFKLAAQISAPEDLYIGVYPWSYSDIFTKVIGAQDIEVQDPAFDRAFVIKSKHTEWARLWLGERVRAAMMQMPGASLSLKSKRASVQLTFSLADDLPRIVSEALSAVLAVGAQGASLLAGWDALARDNNGTLSIQDGAISIGTKVSFEHRAVPIEIEITQEKRGLFSEPELLTRICGRKQSATPESFAVREEGETDDPQVDHGATWRLWKYKMTAASPKRLVALLSQHEEALVQLQPKTFMGEGEIVSMTLRGVVLSRETLLKAANVVAAFCPVVSDEPYR